MKKLSALIILSAILILNLTSCWFKAETPDSPSNYPNTLWVSNQPEISLEVLYNRDCRGKVIINGIEKNIDFEFEFYCNDVSIVDEEQELLLKARYNLSNNEFKIYSISDDKLFEGVYDSITFIKET